MKAKADADTSGKVRDEWRGRVVPMTESGDLTADRLNEVLKSTALLYKGPVALQFE